MEIPSDGHSHSSSSLSSRLSVVQEEVKKAPVVPSKQFLSQ